MGDPRVLAAHAAFTQVQMFNSQNLSAQLREYPNYAGGGASPGSPLGHGHKLSTPNSGQRLEECGKSDSPVSSEDGDDDEDVDSLGGEDLFFRFRYFKNFFY